MEVYKEMYLILFNAITEANKILIEAQKKAEKKADRSAASGNQEAPS
mgnify:CR=1 FL=1